MHPGPDVVVGETERWAVWLQHGGGGGVGGWRVK